MVDLLCIDYALAANGSHIQVLLRHQMDVIISAKLGSNAALLNEVCKRLNRSEFSESAPDDLGNKGFSCGFQFTNEIALNDSHPGLRVNFLETGNLTKRVNRPFFWVTNLPIYVNNVYGIVRAGHTPWKVESELFNVIKKQGVQSRTLLWTWHAVYVYYSEWSDAAGLSD